LGLFIQLLQGLNHLWRHDMGANNLPGEDLDDTEVQKAHLIFTGQYKEIVTSDFLQIGFLVWQRCDTDIPWMYFPSGYLPNESDKNNISTGKMAHEMHGVLLVVLVFLLTEKHRKHLQEKLGCIVLENTYIYLN